MAQNIYDDEAFFSGYSSLQRSVNGHDGAPEWPTLRGMLPDLGGCSVLDLGCGFGWFSRWAAANGAVEVIGIDLSERMLARARAEATTSAVTYQRHDLDLVELEPAAFDLAYSSLTLHYLQDLPVFLRKVHSRSTLARRRHPPPSVTLHSDPCRCQRRLARSIVS